MATYTCKYCGYQSSSSSFDGRHCDKSLYGKHEIMCATEKLQKYTCRYCKHQSSSPSFAGRPCSKSPHGKHELFG